MLVGGAKERRKKRLAFFHWTMLRITVPVMANNQVKAVRQSVIAIKNAPTPPNVM